MIHDAEVEVTCDRDGCRDSVYVRLSANARGGYLCDDSKIESEIESRDYWVVRDGKHYCSEECAKTAEVQE